MCYRFPFVPGIYFEKFYYFLVVWHWNTCGNCKKKIFLDIYFSTCLLIYIFIFCDFYYPTLWKWRQIDNVVSSLKESLLNCKLSRLYVPHLECIGEGLAWVWGQPRVHRVFYISQDIQWYTVRYFLKRRKIFLS